MIIYVGSEKGGVGKTTMTLMMGVYIKQNYDVTLKMIDTDIKQQSLFKLMELRKKNNLDYCDVSLGGDLSGVKKNELCLIDGRANLQSEDSVFLNGCDLVLILVSDSYLEIENTKSFIKVLEKNNIPYKILLNRIHDKKTIDTLKSEFKNVLNTVIGVSERYRKIEKNGETDLDNFNVYKWYTRRELENLLNELFNK